MPELFMTWFQRRNTPTPTYADAMGNEHGELPVDDPPPMEHPSEQYPAWRASAIFHLSPFSAPPGR